MFFHELGHALVASYYGAFKGFGIHGMALTTKVNGDLVPKNRINTTLVSGMLFNILTMSIVMPLFINNHAGIVGYIIIVLGCGAGDIYCMFKGEMFSTKVDNKNV